MKKKEYVSPDFKVINLNSKRYFLLGSGLESKKLSVKEEYFNQKNIIDDDGDLD